MGGIYCQGEEIDRCDFRSFWHHLQTQPGRRGDDDADGQNPASFVRRRHVVCREACLRFLHAAANDGWILSDAVIRTSPWLSIFGLSLYNTIVGTLY